MDCSYCRKIEDEYNYPHSYNKQHYLCSECYKKWQQSEQKGECPICKYETIKHLGYYNLGEEWGKEELKRFKKRYNL